MKRVKTLSIFLLLAMLALPFIGIVAADSNTELNSLMTIPRESFGLDSFTTESFILESAHPYSNNFDYTWTINVPDATQIRVHFTKIDTEYRYDYVYVYDYANVRLHRLTGLYS